MAAGIPNTINDSFFANAVFRFLTEEHKPLSAAEIADSVIPIQNVPVSLSEKMLQIILRQDTRFKKIADGRWTLAEQEIGAKQLTEMEYVVLDVEIVGHASQPHIIEIAAYHLKQMEIVAEFCSFVNPGRTIIPKLIAASDGEADIHIDSEHLQNAPSFDQLLPAFFQFLGGKIVVAHNAHFDLRMINKELKRLGAQKLVNCTIDTLKISRKFVTGTDTQKLPNLAYYYNIPLNAHHIAREDARTLARIFPHLISLLLEHNITRFDQMEPFLIHP